MHSLMHSDIHRDISDSNECVHFDTVHFVLLKFES